MNADGARIEQITFNDVRDEPSSWSPDGRMIAFHRNFDVAHQQPYNWVTTTSTPCRRTAVTSSRPDGPPWRRCHLTRCRMFALYQTVVVVDDEAGDALTGRIVTR
jgi:hypothetical protein